MGGEWFTRRRPPHKLAGNSLLMAGRAEREREAKKNDDLMLEIEEQFKNSKKNQALHLSPPSKPENETAGAGNCRGRRTTPDNRSSSIFADPRSKERTKRIKCEGE